MSKNTFKIQSQKKEGVFARIERTFNLGNFFENGLPIKYLPNIGFVTLLIIIYIGYNHNAEKTSREINKLEIEVTNLSANRIRDLDIRQVDWKIFHEINFVSHDYKKFDASQWPLTPSGLLGPVRLTPMKTHEME